MNTSDINKIQRDITVLKSDITRLEADITSVNEVVLKYKKDLSNIDKQKNEKIKEETQKAKDRCIADLSIPYNKDIKDLEYEKSKNLTLHQSMRDNITYENIKKDYSEYFTIIDDVQDSISDTKEQLSDFLSSRFSAELDNQLSTKEIIIDINDLSYYTDRFNKRVKKAKFLNRTNKFNFYNRINKLLKFVTPCKDDSDPKVRKMLIAYSVGFVVITFIVYLYLNALFLLGWLLIALYNVFKSHSLYSLKIELKVLEDNVTRMSSTIDNEISEELGNRHSQLDERKDNLINDIDHKISIIQEKLNEHINKVNNTFKYDSSNIESDYENTRVNLIKSIDDNNSTILKMEGDKLKLEEQVSSLNAELVKMFTKLPEIYLSVTEVLPPDFYKLDSQFFMDLNQQTKTPMFWLLPDSAMFMCSVNNKVFEQFSNLVMLQLYKKLSPFYIDVVYVDLEFECDFIKSFEYRLSTKSGDKSGSLVRYINTIEDFNSLVENIDSEFDNRYGKIKAPYDTIVKYNDMMYSSHSVPISYKFYFFENFPVSYLSHPKMKAYLHRAHMYGIYFIFNFNLNKVKSMSVDLLEDLLGTVSENNGLSIITEKTATPNSDISSEQVLNLLVKLQNEEKQKRENRG